MPLAQNLRECGVVGAGGAGFPTSVKSSARVEYVLANGAECEPLLHKDAELMERFPAEIVAGMELMMEATGARRGMFGIKEKNARAIEAIRPHLKPERAGLVLLGDFYPSGDEYELVYTATGRLIPAAGIPLQAGCVVNNVETLYNVHQASQGRPVTRKFVSIAGAVRQPRAFWVPVGTPFRDLIELAGGADAPGCGVFVGGVMMGRLTFDLDEVVTKTLAGLIVLPREHYLVQRKARPVEMMHRIGKSACDQCTYCTELCPRYLLGYEVVPHQVMRSLGFTRTGAHLWNQSAELCCACGLCTLYSCPEDLYPKEACDRAKHDLRAAGIKFVQQKPVAVHPMKEARRVPLAMLRRRLKIEAYEAPTPYSAAEHRPRSVRILLSQHVGQPARPVVSPGDRVECGAAVGRVPEPEWGADVHASIAGKVKAVTQTYVEIEA
ncbi:MAG: SLBB domain-containing protein [Bryobacterales bacterium]|nr:SLBB domain-containing protein [Bryobacterales bacterium]